MKLLSLSLDPLILNPQSVVALRNARYGKALETYVIIVPSPQQTKVELAANTTVYGTGGSHKLVQFWLLCMCVIRVFRENHFDVITSQDTYFLGLVGFFFSRVYKTGLEVQVLGIEKLNFFRKKIAQFTLRHAHSIRVLSLGLKKRLLKEFGISEERMRLVPIYVDVTSLGYGENIDASQKEAIDQAISRFHEQYGNRFNIVSVNRLVPIKNIDMQLQAVAELNKKHPEILLHIVGDGPLREALQTEIERLGLTHHVILQGAQFGAALRPFFSESDCFVLTSDFEGYGMVVVEAATAGACIVMTDVGCAGEVIVNEESGLTVPPSDTKAFTSALERIITDSALRDRLQAGARKSIAELPTFDKVLDTYKASWQQAVEHSKT